MNNQFWVILLSVLAALAPEASPQDVPRFQDLMNKGQSAAGGKHWSDALEAYEKAQKLPAEQASKQERAEASLKAAIAIESWHVHDKNSAPDMQKAVAHYQAVLAQGDDDQRIKAANNLGVYHFTTKDYATAVKVFEKELPNLKGGSDATVYRYNYARALEGAEQWDTAFRQYLKSFGQEPKFLGPLEGAERIAFHPQRGRLDLARDLIDASLNAKRVQTAQTQLAKAISQWGNDLESLQLIPQFLTYCSEARVLPADFVKDPAIVGAQGSRHLGSIVFEMKNLYSPGYFKGAETLLFYRSPADHRARLNATAKFFPKILGAGNEKDLEPRFPTPARRALSSFLVYLADRFVSEGLRRKEDAAVFAHEGAIRHMAAWVLDLTHVQAALQFSLLLRDYSGVLDPEGITYADFLEILFDYKGGIYAQGIKLSRKDLEDLYSLHRLLGDVLSKRTLPGRGDATTAVYQYGRAINVENRIRTEYDKTFPISESLQKAYQAAGGK